MIISRKNWLKNPIIKTNFGVSNMIGSILILMISVTIATSIYAVVLDTATNSSDDPSPSTNLVGVIEGDTVVLEHRGGESLPLNTEITLTIFNNKHTFSVESIWDSCNGDSNQNNLWDIGEQVRYSFFHDLSFLYIYSLVTDKESNTIVQRGLIQDGEKGDQPYIMTKNATKIIESKANLNMEIFNCTSVEINFRYRIKGSYVWEETNWFNRGPGTYVQEINGLSHNSIYEFEARMRSGNNPNYVYKSGGLMEFSTIDVIRALWHFDNDFVPKNNLLLRDSSGNSNHGNLKPLYPNENNRPQWTEDVGDRVGDEGCALRFDGIDDYVEVTSSNSLCLTDSLTLETWVKPLGVRQEFQSAVKKQHDVLGNCGTHHYYENDSDIINVYGDIYVIIYRERDNAYGMMATVNITKQGIILNDSTSCVIEYFAFETNRCYKPNVIKVNWNEEEQRGDFAIVYQGSSNYGYLKTVEIDHQGHILGVNHTHIFLSQSISDPKIIKVMESENIFAISFTKSSDNHGYLSTVEIDKDGKVEGIQLSEIFIEDSEPPVNIDDSVMIETDIVHVNEDIYAITFRGDDDDGFIRTIRVSSNGENIDVLGKETTDYSIRYDENDGWESSIVKMNWFGNNGIFAIAYGCQGDSEGSGEYGIHGQLVTIIIDENGVIDAGSSGVGIDKLKFETTNNAFFEPDIINISWENNQGYCGVVYRGPDNTGHHTDSGDGYIQTMRIYDNGSIEDDIVDKLEFERLECFNPEIININWEGNEGVFAIAHSLQYYTGILKTIRISSNGILDDYAEESDIDSCELGYLRCYYEKSSIKISENVFAIVYRGYDDDGFIKTVSYDPIGCTMNDIYIDSLEFEKYYCQYPDIIHVMSNIYAIAYKGKNGDGYITTVSIQSDGSISNEFIHKILFDPSHYCTLPDIINIKCDGNNALCAIVYRGLDNDGYLTTVNINSIGEISLIKKSEFYFTNSYFPDIIEINWDDTDGGVYAIAFRGSGHNGYLMTLKILPDGNISFCQDVNDRLIIEDTDNDWRKFRYPEIFKVGENVFAVAYSGSDYNGWIKTFHISDDGNITQEIIDEQKFVIGANEDSVNYGMIDEIGVVHINDCLYAIASSGYYYDGYLSVIEIGEGGSINDSVHNYKFETGTLRCPSIIALNWDETNKKGLYAIFYSGWRIGSCSLIEISLKPSTDTTIIKKEDSYGISIEQDPENTNSFYIVGEINDREVISASSFPLIDDWTYIVLTYNSSLVANNIKLYLNSGELTLLNQEKSDYQQEINVNDNKIIIGKNYVMMDETVIYSEAKDQNWITFRAGNPRCAFIE